MDRLTGWDGGNPYVRKCFREAEDSTGVRDLDACEHMDTLHCIECEHNLDVFRLLAQYEDTRLTPEEIKSLYHDGGLSIAIRNRDLMEENIDLRARLEAAEAEIKKLRDEYAELNSFNDDNLQMAANLSQENTSLRFELEASERVVAAAERRLVNPVDAGALITELLGTLESWKEAKGK